MIAIVMSSCTSFNDWPDDKNQAVGMESKLMANDFYSKEWKNLIIEIKRKISINSNRLINLFLD